MLMEYIWDMVAVVEILDSRSELLQRNGNSVLVVVAVADTALVL
jgi:hypothetical protein